MRTLDIGRLSQYAVMKRKALMYNLLIGFAPDVALGGRVFEYTEPEVLAYVSPANAGYDLSRLAKLPALVMPETGFDEPQIARVGRLKDLAWARGDLRFRFVPNPTLPAIPIPRIQEAAAELEIRDWEFTRTHWAVKAVDLYGVLAELQTGTMAPRVLRVPFDTPREPDLVAVMMPFDGSLVPVYEALGKAAAAAGFRCQRADDIWDHPHIMDDIVSLIWRAQTVISDFTGKNPNVFYETGIAHTLGRDVVPITQTLSDVPFDLRSIRNIVYLNNGEGREQLAAQVEAKLGSVVARP